MGILMLIHIFIVMLLWADKKINSDKNSNVTLNSF